MFPLSLLSPVKFPFSFALILPLVLTQHQTEACPKGPSGNAFCSGHGRCNQYNACACHPRFQGHDCSQKTCSFGNAVTMMGLVRLECSGRGNCDRKTGQCNCHDAYTGDACQRMKCPNECSNQGECVNMGDYVQWLGFSDERQYQWDQDVFHGCKCEAGYSGYDCSQRTCPYGDDPLTTGQHNEVHTFVCMAVSGSFQVRYLSDYVKISSTLTGKEAVALMQKALTALSKIADISVIDPQAPICQLDPVNPVIIEFTENFGRQHPVQVVSIDLASMSDDSVTLHIAYGGDPIPGAVSVLGDKENMLCSGRGICDRETGSCHCFSSSASTPADTGSQQSTFTLAAFTSSDGAGNLGMRGDCGALRFGSAISPGGLNTGITVYDCPGEVSCSGHGFCSGFPSYVCLCKDGWTSGDCSERSCPKGWPWFPIGATDSESTGYWDFVPLQSLRTLSAPAPTECSSKGLCDRDKGECYCQQGFTGTACHIASTCYRERNSNPVDACSGHGECLTIQEVATELGQDYWAQSQLEYWAQMRYKDTVSSCFCDQGYTGYDCSLRKCPRGDNPDSDGVKELQLLQCTATAGSFQLIFKTGTSTKQTQDIPFDANIKFLQDSLQSLLDENDQVVSVLPLSQLQGQSISDSERRTVCGSTFLSSPLIAIEFYFGNVEKLGTSISGLLLDGGGPGSGSVSIAADGDSLGGILSLQGTTESSECSEHGACDYSSGTCICEPGFGMSDGKGGLGDRADCGYRDIG